MQSPPVIQFQIKMFHLCVQNNKDARHMYWSNIRPCQITTSIWARHWKLYEGTHCREQLDTGPKRVNRSTYLMTLRNYYICPVKNVQIWSSLNSSEVPGTHIYSKNLGATKNYIRKKRARNQILSQDPLILDANIQIFRRPASLALGTSTSLLMTTR